MKVGKWVWNYVCSNIQTWVFWEIPVKDDPLLMWIVQNWSPWENDELVILFDDVKCMHESREGRCNVFVMRQNCAKVEVACMGEGGITRPMLILGGDRSQIHCWNISSRGHAALGKPASKACLEEKKVWMSKDVTFSAYTRTLRASCSTMSDSDHQGLEGKKQEPRRVWGMQTPVVFAKSRAPCSREKSSRWHIFFNCKSFTVWEVLPT